MGPLIPLNIIDPAWNHVIAILIGIAFGFILESSGFSSSRKLAGVFYGYDFTVLKVFFTAAITAAIGLYYFHYMGWIDASYVYINPTYLGPAIVGGIVMGLGFIMGGYCPGTSYTGVAIGKIDAIAYSIAFFVGVFIFAEFYPLYEQFYNSGSMGGVMVFDTLGLTPAAFIIILIVVALGMFVGATQIQNKVKKVDY